MCKARRGAASQLCIAARKRFGEYPSRGHGSEFAGVAPQTSCLSETQRSLE